MGVVLMSKRELNRIDVLARLDGGRLTTSAAADLMRLTTRQTHRLLKRYRDGGAPAIANRRRGQPSNNRVPEVVRDHAVALVHGFAERLIGSIRRECLDHIVVFGEAHLRRILRSYACYYNEIRTHRSLDKDAPASRPVQRTGIISSRAILGGLHHHYVRI